MNKYKRCGDRYPFDLFDAKLKDLKLKYELKEDVIAEVEDRVGVMAFWRYSYAARAFLTDLDEKRGFRKRYNDAREYLKEILKKDVGDSEELFECMVRKLVVTHNEKINKNPRFPRHVAKICKATCQFFCLCCL